MSDPLLVGVLALASVTQVLAAFLAVRQMADVGPRYQLAWGALSIALMLMVARRIAPLMQVVAGGAGELAEALIGLAVSLLMVLGILGVRRLFLDLRAKDETLEELARSDGLTGLLNRRETQVRLAAELARSLRTGKPVSLVMFDLDHFKVVNDRHGHAAGDAVLLATADVLRRLSRRIDACGRWGGEEFLLVLPETDTAEAAAAAERLREALVESPVSIGGGREVLVTASFGVAAMPPGGDPTEPEALVAAADRALYAAKAGGRNRVEVSGPDDSRAAAPAPP